MTEYEYAGFKFRVEEVLGKIKLIAEPGQRPAAYKEKHARAALECYLSEATMREFVNSTIEVQRALGTVPSRNVDLMKEWSSWSEERQARELESIRTHFTITEIARRAGVERANAVLPRRPRT